MVLQIGTPTPSTRCTYGSPTAVASIRSSAPGFDQAARIQKFRLAQARSDKLQAGDGNGLPFHWHQYRHRQRRIPRKVYCRRVLRVEHLQFKQEGRAEEWKFGWQLLKRWQGNEVNLLKDLAEVVLPRGLPLQSILVIARVFQFAQINDCLRRAAYSFFVRIFLIVEPDVGKCHRFPVLLSLVPFRLEGLIEFYDLKSLCRESIVEGFVNRGVGAVNVKPPNSDIFGRRFGCDGSFVSGRKPPLQ